MGRLVIHKAYGGYDTVGAVEALRFADGTVSVASLGTLPITYFGTGDADTITISGSNDIVLSGDGYDRIVSVVSYRLGDANEALELTGGELVLEVGTGSGYQAAVLAQMARKVTTLDRHRQLVADARARFGSLRLMNVLGHGADVQNGWPKGAP